MKTSSIITAIVIVAIASPLVYGQDYAQRVTNNGTPVIHHHASTYSESVLRGWADFTRAAGDYNYNTSLGLINREEALSRHYENQIKKVHTYFEMRRLNKEYREAERGPRRTNEEIARTVAKPEVKALTSHELDRVLNRIYWPAVLQLDVFTPERQALDLLYASRTATNSGHASVNEFEMLSAIKDLRAKVGEYAKDLGANNYIDAKRFLDGLALEATTPELAQGLASNP